jgi:pyruvate/2-oxoglutarate/acetoin dehydrogenase E1 component
LPLGKVDYLTRGKDISLVTYGANCRIAMEAYDALLEMGIELEIIDVQTLLPFDLSCDIRASIMKTNAVIFFDEDVPGGATSYMMQEVLEKQGAYDWMDTKPRTLTAEAHRSAYASDADYYCKPSAEDLIHLAVDIMEERNPKEFQSFR